MGMEQDIERLRNDVGNLYGNDAKHGERIVAVEKSTETIKESQERMEKAMTDFIAEINGDPKQNRERLNRFEDDCEDARESMCKKIENVSGDVKTHGEKLSYYAGGLALLSFIIILYLGYLQFKEMRQNNVTHKAEVVNEQN